MSLYKRGSVWMMDFIVKGVRVHKSTECSREADAKKVEKLAKEELQKAHLLGKLQKPKEGLPTLTDATERLYRESWSRQASGAQTRSRLFYLAEVYGNVTLDKIDKDFISEVRQGLLEAGQSVATTNRYLAHLRTLLNAASDDWGLQVHVPRFRLEKEQNGRRVVISREQELAFTNFFRTSRWKPRQYFYSHTGDLIEVLVDTGMRLGECLNGEFGKNFDLQRGIVSLYPDETKSGKARSIPMTLRVKGILTARHQDFPTRPFPYFPWQVSDAFRAAKKVLGFTDPDLCLHSCRHTFASRLLESGQDIRTVQVLLGHAAITTTERYTHLSTPKLQAAIEALGCGENRGDSVGELRGKPKLHVV